jgi:hypothetical protein
VRTLPQRLGMLCPGPLLGRHRVTGVEWERRHSAIIAVRPRSGGDGRARDRLTTFGLQSPAEGAPVTVVIAVAFLMAGHPPENPIGDEPGNPPQ